MRPDIKNFFHERRAENRTSHLGCFLARAASLLGLLCVVPRSRSASKCRRLRWQRPNFHFR